MPLSRRPLLQRLVLLALLVLVTGCVTIDTEYRDWKDYTGPGAQYFHRAETPWVQMSRDPGEPTNRVFAGINYAFLYGVIQPLGAGWRFIFRDWGTERILNFGKNLAYPIRLLNNLFQAKWGGAWDETKRFGVNTTVGVLGFWDRASEWEMASSKEDTGQTFGRWGWRDPTYLHIPGVGPSSTRDGVGYVGDWLMNPATYLFPLNLVLLLNTGSREVRPALRFTRSNQDPYLLSKYLYSIYRESQLQNYVYHPEGDSAANETLKSVFLTPRDKDFPWKARRSSVLIPATGRDLPYTYRMQPGKAPIVFVLPGLGGHREGDSALAMAEIVWNKGFSFAIISNNFSFEFMRYGSTAPLPGFPRFDVPDMHGALDAVYRDLLDKFPQRITKKALMGLSMGAFVTLGIASLEHYPDYKFPDRIAFDRYIALDAPVNLLIGMQELDDFYNAPMQWPEEGRYDRVRDTIWKTMHLAEGKITPGQELPLTEVEAQYLIGLTFRITLALVIFDSQLRNNQGVLMTELSAWQVTPAYREILDYGYMEYMYAFMLPWLIESQPDINNEQDMLERTGLRQVTEYLHENGKAYLMANEDDFLTTPEDREWLIDTLGEDRVLFHLRGGHIGNLYKPEVQDQITRPLEALLPVTAE